MTTMWWFSVLLFSIVISDVCWCYNFAVFQVTNSKSHMISNGRIADALAEAGHNVTLISLEHTIPSFSFKNAKHARIVSLGHIPPSRQSQYVEYQKHVLDKIFKPESIQDVLQFPSDAWMKTTLETCEEGLKTSKKEIENLREAKFDAIFVEQLFFCGSALGKYLGIPVHFLVNSCPLFNHVADLFGIPWPTGYLPSQIDVALPDKMTFFQRTRNAYEHFKHQNFQRSYGLIDDLFRKHLDPQFDDVKSWIVHHTPFIFVSITEFIDFPKPSTDNFINIGGLGIKSSVAKPLSTELETVIAKGKNGFIFFSMGSNANTAYMPHEVKKHLLESFAVFSGYQFIVRFDAEDTEGAALAASYSNVHITHWVPQPTLLKDSRLKLFITHGGYNSLIEVAIAGKPVLLLPLMYDQQRNAQVVQRNGWGLAIDRVALRKTSKLVQAQIKEILKNDNFSKSAQRIQRILATRPFSPEELLVKNVEFAMANGGRFPELLPASVDLSYIVQENLDVYAAAGAIIIVAVISAVYLLKLVLSFSLDLLKSRDAGKKNE